MNQYMKDRKISPSLQMKIRRFIEFQHEEEKFRSNLENVVFNSLPLDLKQNLYLEANLKTLKKIKIFCNFSDAFLKKLTLKSEEVSIPQDENIFQVSILYIIAKKKIQNNFF